MDLKNGEELLNGAPVIIIKPIKKGTADYFEPADIESVRGYGLDILIKIGFEDLRGDILSASKYGVWEYFYERSPHGFWEVVEGLPETRVDLRILDKDTNGGRTIFSSSSSTYPISPARNRNRSLWKSSSFLPRQIALTLLAGRKEIL